jgi:hypothetical protein
MKVWATHATSAMMLGLMMTAGKMLWSTEKADSAAGNEKSPRR